MFDQAQKTPYVEKFDGRFKPGQTLMLSGKSFTGATEFSVSLSPTDQGPMDTEVTFTMSARFEDGEFVFNSKDRNGWGKEERASLPFKRGEIFYIHIRAHPDRFDIWAQRKLVHKYKHRMTLDSIRRFCIDGQIEIEHAIVAGKFETIPFQQTMSILADRMHIQGVVKDGADKFDINLKAGQDIALNIGARFGMFSSDLIRNSQIGGKWGEEVKSGAFPFKAERIFDITIVMDESAFDIYIDGSKFDRFAHRLPVEKINSVEINGDIELTAFYTI